MSTDTSISAQISGSTFQRRDDLSGEKAAGHRNCRRAIWQYLRANYLSNRGFETYNNIIDASCEAWKRLVALPETITSIGMRDWAHIGQS